MKKFVIGGLLTLGAIFTIVLANPIIPYVGNQGIYWFLLGCAILGIALVILGVTQNSKQRLWRW